MFRVFDPARAAATLFAMSDDVWERHASPWSVWARVLTGWLIFPIVWSFSTIGWGPGMALLIVYGAWIWLNPRLFPKPASTDTWASRATFGERIWLNRDMKPIPLHHHAVVNVLTALAGAGFVAGLVAAALNALWPTVFFAVYSTVAKLWFCDRMVWLYEDVAREDGTVAQWVK